MIGRYDFGKNLWWIIFVFQKFEADLCIVSKKSESVKLEFRPGIFDSA